MTNKIMILNLQFIFKRICICFIISVQYLMFVHSGKACITLAPVLLPWVCLHLVLTNLMFGRVMPWQFLSWDVSSRWASTVKLGKQWGLYLQKMTTFSPPCLSSCANFILQQIIASFSRGRPYRACIQHIVEGELVKYFYQ